ncbi:MAG: response regulator [Deltaproteobacteria bacterium]|nr:response regulator [Deltaproteobacteria bacterium]
MSDGIISVLLVDDDQMIRDCVEAYLEDEGFRVQSAESGEEALIMIAGICHSVCISDMRLPGMNGEEFIIKAHSVSPNSSYLLHTGMLYTLSDELHAIGMTDDDVILKPIHDLSKLVNKIKNVAAAGREL